MKILYERLSKKVKNVQNIGTFTIVLTNVQRVIAGKNLEVYRDVVTLSPSSSPTGSVCVASKTSVPGLSISVKSPST